MLWEIFQKMPKILKIFVQRLQMMFVQICEENLIVNQYQDGLKGSFDDILQ